jgi:opacity protein-like surface antigen
MLVLGAGLFGPTLAWGQCTDNFNVIGSIGGGAFVPAAQFTPLGTGSSLTALTSTINTINTAFLTQSSAFVSAPGNPRPDQQGGGAWARGLDGSVDTTVNSTGTLIAPGIATTGEQHCHTITRQDYSGVQVGQDISVLNHAGSGSNWHLGLTAGYLEARTKDITPGGTFTNPNTFPVVGMPTFTTPPGSLVENSNIPFVGIYTAYTKGSFFADAQARWDFVQNSLTDPNNGLFGQRLDARNFSVTGNLGYNIALRDKWFIEPSAGFVWSQTSVDPLNVAGVLTAGGFIARGSVTVDDVDSALGRASLSIGRTIAGDRITWQPFFTASVYHEFMGDVTAVSTIAGTGNPSIEGAVLTSKSTGGVGTYGQFTLGTAAVLNNTGWLGYARFDYRTGEEIDGWSISGGLRYQFTPEQRGSVKDGGAPPERAYLWSGAYVGGFAGMSWDNQAWSTAFGPSPLPIVAVTHDTPTLSGGLIGGQAGYNWQAGRTVFGIEGDYGFSNSRGGGACDNAGGAVTGIFDFTCQAEIHDLASVTGRVGLADGRALFYVKGGLALGDVRIETKQNSNLPVPPSGTPINGETKWQAGWAVGAGMEFALTNRWSARAEYMHYDLGSSNYAVDSGLTARAHTEDNIARIGLNLHLHPLQTEVAPLK